MKSGRCYEVLVLVGVVLVCPQLLSADISVYLNQTTWEAGSSTLTTIDFAGLGGSPNQSYGSGLTVDGVAFTGSVVGVHEYLEVATASPNFLFGAPDGSFCPASFCPKIPPDSGIGVTLPANATSVGWDFANVYASGTNSQSYTTGLEVQFADGTTYTNTSYTGAVSSGSQFVGFISTKPITSFEILGGGYPTVEDFSFGTGLTLTPEPSLLVAVAIGLLILMLASRRRGVHYTS